MVVANRESMGTPPLRSVSFDQEQLRVSLQEASSRALHYQRNIVACLVKPVEYFQPINLFPCLQQCIPGDCFFWTQPSTQTAFIGCGSAAQIETWGATRFTETATGWQTLVEHAVISGAPSDTQVRFPLFYGGFSFDVLQPTTPLWEGFPHGLLILPQMLFLQEAGQTMVAINILVGPDDDIELHLTQTQALLERFQAALDSHSTRKSMINFSQCMAIHDLRPANEWRELVGNIVRQIQAGLYQKVVLARGVQVTLNPQIQASLDVSQILTRLTRSNPGSYIFAIQRGGRCFTGATPECLVRIHEGQLSTMALAGTAPRGTNELEDEQIGAELLASAKNQGEHHSVVAMLQETLLQFCRQVRSGDQRQLIKLKNVQHLMTPIMGELLAGYSILEVIAHLHPTPAVGGLPRQTSLQAIREQEALDRGWYASPIGWIDAGGGGEFAVALRSGLIGERDATLFAGCGIVAASDPESEYVESCLKLKVMLHGLGWEN
ncbi:isochorismate synthase [Tengunoibacter tsumagoiensis]|nr:isochorismate synthase [Tengunoibacter tsumagoiensis]